MSISTIEGGASKEAAVVARYADAAKGKDLSLCCQVKYSEEYLKVIPEEILQADYGCGDPTSFVHPGETVLDLGSGSGKACYVLSQIVGPNGRVIGVDCSKQMLDLARRHRERVAGWLGYDNVEFRCGMIQDLKLDLELLIKETANCEMRTPDDWLEFRAVGERLRRESPLIPDASVDCVVSNCVTNLVASEDRDKLFSEMYRVLRSGGHVAVSDIVSDRDVPECLQRDPKLWSGCISGAFRQDRFLEALERAGFHGLQIVERQHRPWRTIEGINFRAMTVAAYKGKEGPCVYRRQSVIYRGPFKRVEDDDGHTFARGEIVPVCEKTYKLLARAPYREMFEPIDPKEPAKPTARAACCPSGVTDATCR